jgi:transposase
MSYTVEQKIGKQVYLYEVQSYWDPIKKQPRQRRRYLGKKEPRTGALITPRKTLSPRLSKDFGHVYLLGKIAERIHFTQVLARAFPEMHRDLLDLALFQLIEAKPLYLFPFWADMTYRYGRGPLSSQRISRTLEVLGKREQERRRFLHLWREEQGDLQGIVFDITSLSSYSKLLEPLEWGYNRDAERLPQINLGVLLGQPSELPLAYGIYPGSIADVSTLKNLLVLLQEWELKEFRLVLDRGFYSASNLQALQGASIRFVLPLPLTTKVASSLMSQNARALTSPLSAFYLKKQALFHVRKEIEISGIPLFAHLYLDEKRRAEEIEVLMKRIAEVEEAVHHRAFRTRSEVQAFLTSLFPGSGGLFRVTVQEGALTLQRKTKALSRRINRMGKMILLSNDAQLDREALLLLYRRKDAIEKLFEIMKQELAGNRLRVHSREAMEGRIFLGWLSLILYIALSHLMRDEKLFSSYTVAEVLWEMKKLKVVEMSNGRSYLTEVSKRQRILFEKFRVEVPIGT